MSLVVHTRSRRSHRQSNIENHVLRLSLGNDATIYMMQIGLHGHQIRLEPPQRLAMIEVKRLADGLSFKVIHESGHESEDESVVELSATPEVIRWIGELQRKSSKAANNVRGKQFPIVEVVDLRQLPEQYRLLPEVLPHDFEFTAGEDFRVFVIGQEMVEIVVTAT